MCGGGGLSMGLSANRTAWAMASPPPQQLPPVPQPARGPVTANLRTSTTTPTAAPDILAVLSRQLGAGGGGAMAANTANLKDPAEALDLNNIRNALRRMEDSIIFSLVERAQFLLNDPVYAADNPEIGAFKCHQLKVGSPAQPPPPPRAPLAFATGPL